MCGSKGGCGKSLLARNILVAAGQSGLRAVGVNGRELGVVETVHDYGAGASLEIPQANGAPLIVPFTAMCVPTVDIAGGKVIVSPPDEIMVPEETAVEETVAEETGA